MKKVVVLGATGSIGKSSLEIMSTLPDLFCVVGLVANKNNEYLIALSKKYHCNKLCLCGAESPAFDEISYTGIDGIKRLLDDTKPDIVINTLIYMPSPNTRSIRSVIETCTHTVSRCAVPQCRRPDAPFFDSFQGVRHAHHAAQHR